MLQKDLQKEFAKTKLVVHAWSKMLKIKKQSMQEFLLAQFSVIFAPTIMQTSSIIHFYICFGCVGINHQKGGDCKGIRLTPTS
jgi:hypothetical protein